MKYERGICNIMVMTIPNEKCFTDSLEKKDFPKYTTQLINIANQNSRATRPENVGQLTELFVEYRDTAEEISEDGWEVFYSERYENSVEMATDKIYKKLKEQRRALRKIDKKMVNKWVEDLIFHKTYEGLYIQEKILEILANQQNTTYRLANKYEEKKGIDGYIGDVPYSIKPISYKSKPQLLEVFDAKRVFYQKTKVGIRIEIEE